MEVPTNPGTDSNEIVNKDRILGIFGISLNWGMELSPEDTSAPPDDPQVNLHLHMHLQLLTANRCSHCSHSDTQTPRNCRQLVTDDRTRSLGPVECPGAV